jgi:hypothetical protein
MSNNEFQMSNAEVLTSKFNIRYSAFDINSLNLIALRVSRRGPCAGCLLEEICLFFIYSYPQFARNKPKPNPMSMYDHRKSGFKRAYNIPHCREYASHACATRYSCPSDGNPPMLLSHYKIKKPMFKPSWAPDISSAIRVVHYLSAGHKSPLLSMLGPSYSPWVGFSPPNQIESSFYRPNAMWQQNKNRLPKLLLLKKIINT